MMAEALMIAKREHLFIPMHNQPMAWAMRNTVSNTVQASDNKPRLWLTQMR
jgi:peptide/nickel transport system substrate-binding protein